MMTRHGTVSERHGNASDHPYTGWSSSDVDSLSDNVPLAFATRTQPRPPRLLTSMLPEVRERLRVGKSRTSSPRGRQFRAPVVPDVDIGALPAPVPRFRSVSPEVLHTPLSATGTSYLSTPIPQAGNCR